MFNKKEQDEIISNFLDVVKVGDLLQGTQGRATEL